MKFLKILAAAAAVCASTFSAMAQYDFFAEPTWCAPWATSTQITVAGTTTQNVTNQPIDLRSWVGVVGMWVSGNGTTYGASGASLAGTNTIYILGSPNGTNNWTGLTNYAVGTVTSIIYTNYVGTSNASYVQATNVYGIPGTVSNAVPSANLFAGQFYIQAPFTNYNSAVASGTNFQSFIGFNVNDQPRYLEVVVTAGGVAATTNYWFDNVIMVGRRSNPRFY